MFGYVVPDKGKLKVEDFLIYNAFYCGVCIASGELFGQLPRILTSYDAAFLAVFINDVLGGTVEFEDRRCIFGRAKTRSVVKNNALMTSIASCNILFFYHSLTDAVLDGDVSKKIALAALKKAYGVARERCPKEDRIIERNLAWQQKVEREGKSGIDEASQPFATMLAECGLSLVKGLGDSLFGLSGGLNSGEGERSSVERGKLSEEDERSSVERGKLSEEDERSSVERGKLSEEDERSSVERGKLSEGDERSVYDVLFCLGKWVYMMDAADDARGDYAKKRFNPFVNEFGACKNREQFFSNNREDIEFVLNSALLNMRRALERVRLTQSRDLIWNIALDGLNRKTAMLYESKRKLKRDRI